MVLQVPVQQAGHPRAQLVIDSVRVVDENPQYRVSAAPGNLDIDDIHLR